MKRIYGGRPHTTGTMNRALAVAVLFGVALPLELTGCGNGSTLTGGQTVGTLVTVGRMTGWPFPSYGHSAPDWRGTSSWRRNS